MKTNLLLSFVLLTAIVGCEVPELETQQATAPVQSEQTSEPSLMESAAHVSPDSYLPDGRVDMSGVKDEPPMTNATPREVTAKDPKKGKLSRRAGGYLGSTVDKLPWVEAKAKFDMIKYNLNVFDADKGYFPRSHEEFMEVYLPQYYPAALPLPELEPGDEYIYDPDDHLLKIWRPGDAETQPEASEEAPE